MGTTVLVAGTAVAMRRESGLSGLASRGVFDERNLKRPLVARGEKLIFDGKVRGVRADAEGTEAAPVARACAAALMAADSGRYFSLFNGSAGEGPFCFSSCQWGRVFYLYTTERGRL
jgi:hypothetical protein